MRATLIVRPLAADTIVYTVLVLSNDRFTARFVDSSHVRRKPSLLQSHPSFLSVSSLSFFLSVLLLPFSPFFLNFFSLHFSVYFSCFFSLYT